MHAKSAFDGVTQNIINTSDYVKTYIFGVLITYWITSLAENFCCDRKKQRRQVKQITGSRNRIENELSLKKERKK